RTLRAIDQEDARRLQEADREGFERAKKKYEDDFKENDGTWRRAWEEVHADRERIRGLLGEAETERDTLRGRLAEVEAAIPVFPRCEIELKPFCYVDLSDGEGETPSKEMILLFEARVTNRE